MKRLTWYIGQGFDVSGNSLTDTATLKAQAETHLAATYGGFSESSVSGGWISDASHALVTEPSLRLEVVTKDVADTVQTARAMATWLKALYRQESVLLTVENLDTVEFV